MHTIQVYIDETLSEEGLKTIKNMIRGIPHVTNVEANASAPHDVVVEYEEHHNIPMQVIDKLHDEGLHPDITSA